MSTEICIRIPDNPDVVRQIGELTHMATLCGSDVRIRRLADNVAPPIGSLTQQTAVPPPDEFDITAGDTQIDPNPTPSGGTRRSRQGNRQNAG